MREKKSVKKIGRKEKKKALPTRTTLTRKSDARRIPESGGGFPSLDHLVEGVDPELELDVGVVEAQRRHEVHDAHLCVGMEREKKRKKKRSEAKRTKKIRKEYEKKTRHDEHNIGRKSHPTVGVALFLAKGF